MKKAQTERITARDFIWSVRDVNKALLAGEDILLLAPKPKPEKKIIEMLMSYKEKEYYSYSCGACSAEWDMEIFKDELYCPACGKKAKPYSVGDSRGMQ